MSSSISPLGFFPFELTVRVLPSGDSVNVGQMLFSSGVPATGLSFAPRAADVPVLSWRVRVWPRDPAAFAATVGRRQTVYVVMLSLVLMLLAFGTYLTSRVVRRELEVARLKADFVSTVSHEFRTPLTGIRQLSELLMRGRLCPGGLGVSSTRVGKARQT